MGHPTMQENDTAKLTPTSLYSIFKQSNIHFIHLIPFFRIFASNGTF